LVICFTPWGFSGEKNSIVLTSNKSFSQWAELAADPIIMIASCIIVSPSIYRAIALD